MARSLANVSALNSRATHAASEALGTRHLPTLVRPTLATEHLSRYVYVYLCTASALTLFEQNQECGGSHLTMKHLWECR